MRREQKLVAKAGFNLGLRVQVQRRLHHNRMNTYRDMDHQITFGRSRLQHQNASGSICAQRIGLDPPDRTRADNDVVAFGLPGPTPQRSKVFWPVLQIFSLEKGLPRISGPGTGTCRAAQVQSVSHEANAAFVAPGASRTGR